ncbi:G2/M phase-specific E3 ubiquitin-protein ligase-like [Anneissia japonica]|uniref:G2/M phase-specific E3 ubiquitin-protein ligase-like n=1 Tax=Anneissia japonica TaxID=1529436 RepID=UPI0014257891|nr:G2/M phase-specific E3 ubiquitin-protein ligase-like [Anneissia japonica]
MVCLSKPDADTTPRSEEKQLLIDVGLGEKTVFIPDINISPEQFCQVLYTYFPKLQDAGGFELLTCIGSERKLVTIRGKYTPQNIKDRLGQGRIYIRPIQNSLNLDPVDSGVDVDSGLMQKCSKCQKEFPFNILKKHIESCSRPSPPSTLTVPMEQEDGTDDLYDADLTHKPRASNDMQTQSTPLASYSLSGIPSTSCSSSESHLNDSSSSLPTTAPEQQDDVPMRPLTGSNAAYNAYVELHELESEDDDTDLMRAISESLEFKQPGATSDTVTLKDLLTNYQQISKDEKTTVIVHRRRFLRSILHAYCQPGFDCHKSVIVEFAGEEAVDIGGPKREMFRLLMKAVSESMGVLEGGQGLQTFTHNIELLEDKKYMVAGSFVARSLLHGGPGLPTLHPELFKLMCGIKSAGFSDVSIVNDIDVRLKISKIANCCTGEEYMKVSQELGDWASDQGVMSLYNGDITQKDTVVASLLKHYCFYRTQAEIQQFVEGLGALWTIVKDFPDTLMPLLTSVGKKPMSRDVLKSIMKVRYSEEGSNLKLMEDDTIFCWEIFLKDCEDGKTKDKTSLNDILAFISGADVIPPMGFEDSIDVEFFTPNPDARAYPTASTCALEL